MNERIRNKDQDDGRLYNQLIGSRILKSYTEVQFLAVIDDNKNNKRWKYRKPKVHGEIKPEVPK